MRVDILERLADLIRPAVAWRFTPQSPTDRAEGAWDGAGFMVTPAMLSILGATHENMADILRGLGYRGDSMLETDANAKLEQWDNAAAAPLAEGEQDGAAESKGEAVGVKDDADSTPVESGTETSESTPPSDKDAKPEQPAEPSASAAAEMADSPNVSDAKPASAKAEPAEPEEPKRIDIWRQNREGRPARRQFRKGGQDGSAAEKDGKGGRGNYNKHHKAGGKGDKGGKGGTGGKGGKGARSGNFNKGSGKQ